MHPWGNGQEWKTEDIRTLLCQLPGVSAAGVKFADDALMEEIEEIHILSDVSRNPKQIVRDVQSALFAAFGMQIDHRIVSVAQMAIDIPSEEKSPARVRYKGMSYEESDESCTFRVTLEYGGRDYSGEANSPGAKVETYRMNMIAQATLDAIAQLVGDDKAYDLMGVQKIAITGVPLVVVLVQCVEEDNRILSGSACCATKEMQSIVRATLDAVNRNLEKRLIALK